jgi:hypothetical protein
MKVMTEVQRNVLPFWLVFDEISKKARTFFLDMPIVNTGTGENLFNALDKCLR